MMNQEDYINERVIDQINWYSKKSAWNKRMSYFFSISTIILSSIIPIISILDSSIETPDTMIYPLCIAVIAAIISIISGVSFICKFNDNWIAYRTTAETLTHELNLFQTQSGSYKKEHSLQHFVLKIESMISQENSNWSKNSADENER